MKSEVNPFHELYVTEMVSPQEFVVLFSPFLVKYAQLLFKQGNLILLGSQGSGKSMLLSLLKPEIREAYFRRNENFPVPQLLQGFLGAGVNINRSGAINIGQRPVSSDENQDKRLFPLYFADFLNYFVAQDILKSISFVKEHPDAFQKMVFFERADEFARSLADESCWFGYLDSVKTFEELVKRLDDRIGYYRQYHQFNIDQLPEEINASKTAIGEPISRIAYCLRETGLLSANLHLLIRIDELNILHEADELRGGLGEEYRKVINKALASRDPLVSYKIGSRTYAWKNSLTVFGTKTSLEKERDYKVLDLDLQLRREEDPKTWIFPEFAKDVFARRLKNSNFATKKSEEAFQCLMGTGVSPQTAANLYAKESDAKKALQIDERWPQAWKDYLNQLYAKNRLSAILATAWVQQQGGRGENRFNSTPPKDNPPWEKAYWKKERIRQALLQLAGHCGQRLKWCGYKDILALSGGNILVFVSLCQHIWESFLQSERGKPEQDHTDLQHGEIDGSVQAAGIQAASAYWYEKIPERPKGNDRQRFIDILGRFFQKRLYADKAMSNPGHNGFSLPKEELEEGLIASWTPAVRFLNEAVLHSDLYEIPHTTKEKNRKQRIKYYIHPVFSPYFKIPESHVKEPIYIHIRDIMTWMREARVTIDSQGAENQLPLFYSHPQDAKK